MGKKSRLKRERRKEQSKLLEKIMVSRSACAHDYDADYNCQVSKLRDIFSKYNAEDVAVALNVSDLWLPNISSQVKHLFALGVFAAMNMEQFADAKRLDTYEVFCDFIRTVHEALPSFPMLEDFIPEPDWGEVRVACKGECLKIFYGSSVERIPDFIEAFRLLHEGKLEAQVEMEFVILMQHQLISNVNKEVVGNVENIDPGYLEIPSEAFWLQCRNALFAACDNLPATEDAISPKLVLELGKFKSHTWSSFGDAVMKGDALPAVVVRVGKKCIPISLRNATSVVIDSWAEGKDDNHSLQVADLSRSIANFLLPRFGIGSVINGPLHLTSRTCTLSHCFAAVICTNQKFYLIVLIDNESLTMLEKLERDIHDLLASGEEWAIRFDARRGFVQFKKNDGSQPGAEDITIIAVLSRVSTSPMFLPIPETTAHIISLPDFVTVFDSLVDTDELDKFWIYVDSNKEMMSPMSMGTVDLFASFRDSHALLIDGAVIPNFISLDPHWGTNWRYRLLAEFWASAPPKFPDDTLAWKVEPKSDDPQRLIARGTPTLAWYTIIDGCTVHIVFHVLDQELNLLNGRMLELFVHCFADAFSQRRNLLENHSLFRRSRIVLECLANKTTPATEIEDDRTEANVRKPLLDNWQLNNKHDETTLSVKVEVNLARLQSRLDSPIDASFEVECLLEGIAGISSLVGLEMDEELSKSLLATSARRPRFTLKRINRTVDVPDFSTPIIPTAIQYKIARRDLAVVLKNLGVDPGRYELAQAKSIIDPARDRLRAQIHHQIEAFDRYSLLLFSIEQHDALISEYRRESLRVSQSMEHEVSFDRAEALAEAHKKFIRESRNYRYLLEYCASTSSAGSGHVYEQDVVQLLATIDWLFVLYGASDVLHNDIEAAGVELDHSFIPHVFYSEEREAKEREFSLEMADAKLGIDLLQEDEVTSVQEDGKDWSILDQAFVTDLGFSFTHLVQVLFVLARWQALGGDAKLRLSYKAPFSTITDILKNSMEDLSSDEATRIVEFLVLEPAKIRRLLGKDIAESDVPVWEHNKREHRYAIRPLIIINEGQLAWGAAAADRAARIWTGTIFDGYLPADFNWPNVKNVVRNIKSGIEQKLEIRAFEVCSRATSWVLHGIDFKHKFPKESFEDVGDFDTLACWPEKNLWLSVECKYNQPPFCLKDARRLRERIFGSGKDHGQFAKIERRRDFLASNFVQLRKLLGWPEPPEGVLPSFSEVYVCRDIYWWMRNPPFVVPTQFVRIDGLDRWLRGQGNLGSGMQTCKNSV